MSVTGFKKQLNKASQLFSEKIGGAEGTKLDNDYLEIEKEVDVLSKLMEEVTACTLEFLQPNPAIRARLATVHTLQKIRGKSKAAMSPQPEGLLGDCMLKYGREFGTSSIYGQCLLQAGESMKNMADVKYTMEDHIRDSFLHPIHSMQTHELKEINFHRKKLEGRRLDFDCKKRKQDKVPEDELRVSEEKFQESKLLAEKAMSNFLCSEVEHIQALTEFVTAQFEYHRHATEVMEQLQKLLIDKKDECCANPRKSKDPKQVAGTMPLSAQRSAINSNLSTPTRNGPNSFSPSFSNKSASGPSCRGLYDFEVENERELPFSEGDVIRLIAQVDENWYEGELRGRTGFFPINYVEVTTPLPSH